MVIFRVFEQIEKSARQNIKNDPFSDPKNDQKNDLFLDPKKRSKKDLFFRPKKHHILDPF